MSTDHQTDRDFLDEPTEQLEPPRQLAPAILAIDVGGTRFEAGLVTAKGELVDRAMTRVEQDVRDGVTSHGFGVAGVPTPGTAS